METILVDPTSRADLQWMTELANMSRLSLPSIEAIMKNGSTIVCDNLDRILHGVSTTFLSTIQKLGIDTPLSSSQLSVMKWVVVALVYGGTSAASYFWGQHRAGTPPIPIPSDSNPVEFQAEARACAILLKAAARQNVQLRNELENAQQVEKQLCEECMRRGERVQGLEEQEATLQQGLKKEMMLREKNEVEIALLRKGIERCGVRIPASREVSEANERFNVRTPSVRTPIVLSSSTNSPSSGQGSLPLEERKKLIPRSHTSPGSLTPKQQAIKDAFKATIETNTQQLLSGEITSQSLADNTMKHRAVTRSVFSTPSNNRAKRKLDVSKGEEGGLQASTSRSLSTPKARPFSVDLPAKNIMTVPKKLDVGSLFKTGPSDSAPRGKRVRMSADSEAALGPAATGSSSTATRRPMIAKRTNAYASPGIAVGSEELPFMPRGSLGK